MFVDRGDGTRPHSNTGYLVRERLQTGQHSESAARLHFKQAREPLPLISRWPCPESRGGDPGQARDVGSGHQTVKCADRPRTRASHRTSALSAIPELLFSMPNESAVGCRWTIDRTLAASASGTVTSDLLSR
jgi:hypothetical protein